MPTFTPYRFIFSGGRRSRQSRSLYLQKNIAKLGGRSHKHYLWLAEPADKAEAEPHCQCKGGQSASLPTGRGGVKLNIGLSLALPASASLRYGREAEPRRHCNLFSASSSAAPQIYKRNGGRSLYLPPPLRYLILFWIRTKIDTLEECCSTIELRELVQ